MTRNLGKLALLTAVALGLALWVSKSREPATSIGHDQAVLPGLKEAINDVTAVRLVGAEGKLIASLSRKDGHWAIGERDGYPADDGKVRALLLKLADAQLLEAKTSDPALYSKLGVDDIGAKTAGGVQVEIDGPKSAPPKLIVGRFNGTAGDGTFVRRAGEPQSWLAKGSFTIDKTTAEWVNRELLDIGADRIGSLEITVGDKHLRASKAEATQQNFSVADLPKGRELSSEYAANSLASVLSGLRADDVAKAGEIPAGAKRAEVAYQLRDGMTLAGSVWEVDGKDWLRLTASLDEARAAAKIDAEQANEKAKYEADLAKFQLAQAAKVADDAKAHADASKPATDAAKAADAKVNPEAAAAEPAKPASVVDAAKDKADRLDKLKADVAELNRRLDGWQFTIPAYKFANMYKTVDDLLKPLGGDKKDAKAQAAPAPGAPPLPFGH